MEKIKLTAQEKLDAFYELKMALFLGQVTMYPELSKDPNVIEVENGRY